MSQENVALAHRASDAFNRRDLDAFLALADRDVEAYSRIAELQGHTDSRWRPRANPELLPPLSLR